MRRVRTLNWKTSNIVFDNNKEKILLSKTHKNEIEKFIQENEHIFN